nr:iron uptake transporter deferrochelatase/peroxidase subunit [Mycetocola spongiae]
MGLAGAAAGGLAVGGVGGALIGSSVAGSPEATTYPFYGTHQAGIVTPTQDRLHFAAYDLSAAVDREELIALLTDWTIAAERLTRGLEVSERGAVGGSPLAPPDDTGEAHGLDAAGLTITFGFGPTLFRTAEGQDRYGLAERRPGPLVDLPHFSGDTLDPAISGGDLCIQACANDPQVAVHAIRNLSRIAFGRASIRWSQLGFGRTSSTSTRQVTERNLFGFKDGTANIKAEDTAVVDRQVWAGGGDWMAGGSYLVTRKIRMIIETWDRSSLGEQERIFGRNKGEGAPLSGGTEFTPVRLTENGPDGRGLEIDSHVRLAHPESNGGARLLRRGYNYVEGNDNLGRLNAGLFFICFQSDPQKQFIPMQHALGKSDLLNEYIRHIGSGIFAVPPGATPGGYIGQGLFS